MPSGTLTNEYIDLLNRQEFVERMIVVSEMLSENQKNVCYALDGSWGVGKSFVLGMFEEQIVKIQSPETTMGKYLLFHYDCWQYDYYEEPLVAIVAAILDAIDKQICVLSDDKKAVVKVVLRRIGNALVKKANQFVEEKTGINTAGIINDLKSVHEEAEKNVEEKHEFDPHFDFKKILGELRSTIESLAKDQTVIFVVDELDRCLPEYTIKVMERLHHVFDDIPNVQLVLSIDKNQIQHVIKRIYGGGTSVEKYLAKFIDFEIKLEEGTVSAVFSERFKTYTNNFEIMRKDTTAREIEEFVSTALEGIDMRRRISTIEKCQLIHNLVSNNSVMDCSIMCMEILLVLFYESGINLERANQNFEILDPFCKTIGKTESTFDALPTGLAKISKMYASNTTRSGGGKYYKYDRQEDVSYINASTLLGRIIGGYRILIGYSEDYWQEQRNGWFIPSEEKSFWEDYIKKFWSMLQIIN